MKWDVRSHVRDSEASPFLIADIARQGHHVVDIDCQHLRERASGGAVHQDTVANLFRVKQNTQKVVKLYKYWTKYWRLLIIK